MRSLRTSLPPLNSLVAFDAVARHLSFTRAGEELLVSREAVSRQIRILEKFLGVKLFLRLHRALELTEAGKRFHATTRRSLEAIAESANAVQRIGRPAKVTITATIAIASFWLTPRLPRFRASHPDAEIRVVVSDNPVDMTAEGVDVGLRYGDGDWPALRTTHLFDVASFPVCAPGYLERNPLIAAPADLTGHTLLNLDGLSHAVEDWSWWLESAGVEAPPSSRLLGFDSYANIIQAAIDGQGLALGFSGIVDGLLADGALVRPLAIEMSPGHGVYLVVPRGAQSSPNTRDFCDWVISEAAGQAEKPH